MNKSEAMTKLYSDRENESDSQARFFLDQALFYDPGRIITRARARLLLAKMPPGRGPSS